MNKRFKVISVFSENKNFKELVGAYFSVYSDGKSEYLVFKYHNNSGLKYIRINKLEQEKAKDGNTLYKTDIGNFLIKEVIHHTDIINEFVELENGMSVMLRNGEEYIYIDHQFYDNEFIIADIGFFKNDFSHFEDVMKDITNVYDCFGNTLWVADKIK